MRLAGMIAALMVAGCAATLPPVPGRGGPAWFELTTEHFTMWTDLELARAKALLGQMERVQQVIRGVAFPAVASAGRIVVIALRDHEELSMLSSIRGDAFAMRPTAPMWQPMIVLSANLNGQDEDETITHELTHAISYGAIQHQPRWLAEGMAEYFETMQIDIDATIVDVGVAPRDRGRPRRIAQLVPISTLFAWTTLIDALAEQRRYATAWALFTFLINKHRDELLRYLQLLDDDTDPEDESAGERGLRVWDQAFPSLSSAAVDGELQQWLVSGHHVVLHFNIERRDWPTSERKLTDADVHAVRGLLMALAKRKTAALDSLTAALAIEPTHFLARAVSYAYYKIPLSPAQARAIAAAHRNDWRAWALAYVAISEVEGRTAEAVAAEAKVCELVVSSSVAVPPPDLCRAHRASAPTP